ncbi:MAG: WD40 repeat domain-containing protein, partial [Acidobacteria bacterium]|nr:WD40 repeat domain-containing protein [Acidobacteriota bacterium]
VTAVAVLPDGHRLVSASWDGMLKVWEMATGEELATLTGHASRVTAVAVLPDSRRLVSASEDKTLKVWEVETGAELATLTGHTSWVTAVAVLPDGRRLVSASRDHTLKVWEVATGEELATLTGHTSEVTAVAVLPDGRRLVSASSDHTLKVWEVETGAELATLTGHTSWAVAVAVLPASRLLALASWNLMLKVLDVAVEAELTTLTGHASWVRAAAVFPDGCRLASASEDKTLKVWEVETGAELATLTGHTSWVTAVVVLPDGRRLVSASSDHTLKVWDVETRQALLTYFGDAPFLSCAVSPDGKTIFAGDALGRIHFLKLEEACNQLLITNKPNKYFLPAIEEEERPMSLDSLNRKRLLDLEELLTDQFERLFEFQKELGITASAPQRFEMKKRIDREVKPAIQDHLVDYARTFASLNIETTLTQAEAEQTVTEISQAVTALQVRPENTELVKMVSEIHEKLHAPGKTATAKLKVTIPIIPKLVEYVLEADTESGLMAAWNAIRARISKKAQLNP